MNAIYIQRVRRRVFVLALLLAACGGAPAAPPRPPPPSGPARSFLYVPHAFLLRVQCAAIRTTPIAPDVAALWRSSPLFQRLASDSQFDPIRDLDVMVTTTSTVAAWHGGPASSRWRVVLRHHQDAGSARALLGAMASARGAPLVWRDAQGLPSAVLPGEISQVTPHAIVLTAAHEAILAPDDELPAILDAARDQAARRITELDVIEPGLAAPNGELVRAETSDPPEILASLGANAARASVVRSGQGAAVHLELDFGTPGEAQAVATVATSQLSMLAQNSMIVTLGVAHPLAIAQASTQGRTMVLDTQATFDELAAALRALAMFSAS